MAASGLSSDDQIPTPVGEGVRGVSIGAGAGESMGQTAKRTTTVTVDLGELKRGLAGLV